jgi:hypothetical protein
MSDTNELERIKAVGRDVIKALAERNPRALLTPDVQELIKIATAEELLSLASASHMYDPCVMTDGHSADELLNDMGRGMQATALEPA